ncbi:hypothetical protein [Shinella zoogloeoides]|uniref:hypothetical protein n=1 Tax=Shinella zoogloeoides TaxID=352475 RepID=UPI0028A96699|nr:hypothetical protein [Shinella zoogloeoides]
MEMVGAAADLVLTRPRSYSHMNRHKAGGVMTSKVFRPMRYWAFELGAGLAALVCFYLAIAFAFGFESLDKEMLGSKEIMRWFMVATLPVLGSVGAFVWIGARLDFPRVEVTDGAVLFVNVFGIRKDIRLAEYGPAYVHKDKRHKIDYITFFKAEKEAALRQTGEFARPTDSTADLNLPLSFLVGGKQSPLAEEIAEAINAARENTPEHETVSDEVADRMLRDHRRKKRLYMWIMPPLIIGLLVLETMADKKPSTIFIVGAVVMAVTKFFLDYMEDSPNVWVQRIRVAIAMAIYAIIAIMVAMLIWWLLAWLGWR